MVQSSCGVCRNCCSHCDTDRMQQQRHTVVQRRQQKHRLRCVVHYVISSAVVVRQADDIGLTDTQHNDNDVDNRTDNNVIDDLCSASHNIDRSVRKRIRCCSQ